MTNKHQVDDAAQRIKAQATTDIEDLAAAVADLSFTVNALRMTSGTEVLELRGRLRAVENRLAEIEREQREPVRGKQSVAQEDLSPAEISRLRKDKAKAKARARAATDASDD